MSAAAASPRRAGGCGCGCEKSYPLRLRAMTDEQLAGERETVAGNAGRSVLVESELARREELRRWPWKPQTQKLMLRMLEAVGHMTAVPYVERQVSVEYADARTSLNDLRASHALVQGVPARRLCPSAGYDLAKAVGGLPWCCANGRHPGMPVRDYQVGIVVWRRAGDRQEQVLARHLDVRQLLEPDDYDSWHDWAVTWLRGWLCETGQLLPDQKFYVHVYDRGRPLVSGYRGYARLGDAYVWTGSNPASQPLLTDPYWRNGWHVELQGWRRMVLEAGDPDAPLPCGCLPLDPSCAGPVGFPHDVYRRRAAEPNAYTRWW